MRDVVRFELDDVSGGDLVTVGIAVVGAIAGACAFAYSVGKDMAERDNALDANSFAAS